MLISRDEQSFLFSLMSVVAPHSRINMSVKAIKITSRGAFKSPIILQTWPTDPGMERTNAQILVFSLNDVRNSKSGRKGKNTYERVENICYNPEKSI